MKLRAKRVSHKVLGAFLFTLTFVFYRVVIGSFLFVRMIRLMDMLTLVLAFAVLI